MSNKKYVVMLTDTERQELEQTTRKAVGRKALHAYILLKAGEGWTDERIAEAYPVSHATIERVRQRFVEEGISAALSRKQSSRVYRKKIEGDEEAHLVALVCSQPPEGRACWTMQLLADKMVELNHVESVSDETVRRVLKKTNSSPGNTRNGASRRNRTLLSSARWKKS